MSDINRKTTGTGANIITPAPTVHKEAALAPAPPVAGVKNLSLGEKVVHEPEKVVQHAPILEKEVLREPKLEVKREHHIQPVIHETEHRIQPIIKTEATAEQPILEQDKNVMLPPVVQKGATPAGLEAVERVGPEGIIHAPKVERQVLQEPKLEVKREHHIQPIIHEREHRIQPIVKTEATAERPIIEQDKNVMHQPIVERAAVPAGLETVQRVAPEGVIHAPKVAKDVVVEHPVQVKHEHHVQPVIHEREHHIQPIVKTQVSAQETHLKTDKNVMMPPVVERANLPAGLEAVERAGPEGVLHKPKTEKEVLVEHPVEVKHERHIQPIVHEREHHIQPIIKTEATAEQRVIETDKNVMLPPIVEPTKLVGTRPSTASTTAPVKPMTTATPVTTATTTLPREPAGEGRLDTEEKMPSVAAPPALGEREVYHKGAHAGFGQKIKGALKEVQGTLTRNPAKKEEGRMLMHGEEATHTGRPGV